MEDGFAIIGDERDAKRHHDTDDNDTADQPLDETDPYYDGFADASDSDPVIAAYERAFWDELCHRDKESEEKEEAQPDPARPDAIAPIVPPAAVVPGEDGSAPAPAAVPDEPEERKPKRARQAREEEPSAAGVRGALDTLSIRDSDAKIVSGIKFKPQNRDLFCKCPIHNDCTKTRTTNAPASSTGSRSSQGRPLGFLASWAILATHSSSKDDHQKLKPSYEQRVAARSRLQAETNYQQFANFERPCRANETEEPQNCP